MNIIKKDKCNLNCNSCTSNCYSLCPVCGIKGKSVQNITLRFLLYDTTYLNEKQSYLCINRKCPVIYYQEDNPKYFIKDEVKTQIWFKSSLKEYFVCYCHKIKLLDIVEIVKNSEDDDLTKEKIFRLLNYSLDDSHCVLCNPASESCDKLFKNAIEYAYKQKYKE